MTPKQFAAALVLLDVHHGQAAEMTGVSTAQLSRYSRGATPIPRYVEGVVKFLLLAQLLRDADLMVKRGWTGPG